MMTENSYKYITTAGELKQILEKFNDDIPIEFDSSPTTHEMPDLDLGCDIHHVTGSDQEKLVLSYWKEEDMSRELGPEGQRFFNMSYEKWIRNHPKMKGK